MCLNNSIIYLKDLSQEWHKHHNTHKLNEEQQRCHKGPDRPQGNVETGNKSRKFLVSSTVILWKYQPYKKNIPQEEMRFKLLNLEKYLFLYGMDEIPSTYLLNW